VHHHDHGNQDHAKFLKWKNLVDEFSEVVLKEKERKKRDAKDTDVV